MSHPVKRIISIYVEAETIYFNYWQINKFLFVAKCHSVITFLLLGTLLLKKNWLFNHPVKSTLPANPKSSLVWVMPCLEWKDCPLKQKSEIYQDIHHVSKKTVQTYFLSELCQIYTDCENFWHKDGRVNKLFCGILIFHLT